MKRNCQKSVSNSGSIEQEITSIYKSLEVDLKKGLAAEKSQPPKGSTSCKGVISIYRADDLRRRNEDKSYKAIPVERYEFYASIYTPSKIGSVAIYGDMTFFRFRIIKCRGFLFGRKVRSVTIEKGKHLFVDVKLAD